ncbi:MAG: YceI family protein [Flavobacteriaceae bacterium]
MKTRIILIITILIAFTSFSQEKLTTKSGVVKFEASTPNFEPVAAVNEVSSAILKEDGTIAVLTLVSGFKFKKALMQKHFNSKKWVDSKAFPKTSFKGKIVDFKLSDVTAKEVTYQIKGSLTFHGVTKDISTPATISKVDGAVKINTKFTVKVADYGIVVKSKLAAKIAETVNVETTLLLK